jgi:mannosyltransferase OCH1-like enzyme
MKCIKGMFSIGLLLFFGQVSVLKSGDTMQSWHYVPFDVSMQKNRYSEALAVTKKIIGIDGAELYSFFNDLYELNNPLHFLDQGLKLKKVKIPKIIHQVWLGSRLPEVFVDLIKSWFEYHMEGWTYILWTDETIEEFGLYNKAFYDASDNYGVKSDLVKYEVVYRYGGLYVDVDFECLRSLEFFHYIYDFYTGIQPLDTQFVQLGAALFAALPGHPILKHCIETVKDDWHRRGATQKTGPIHLTKSFYKIAGKNGMVDIAFPSTYFYPLGCVGGKWDPDGWLEKGAYAVHHWAKSWMPKKYRQHRFRNIDNDASSESWNQ